MKTEELKSIQAPIKQKYREEPETAFITLRSQGRIGEDITCKIETGKSLVQAGLHTATGGNGFSLCSGDMLLDALTACAGVTLNAVATSMGIVLKDALIKAEGDIDFRGTLAVSKEAPVGFKNIRLKFELDTDADMRQVETLIKLTERYCVVYQTLKNPLEIESGFSVHPANENEVGGTE